MDGWIVDIIITISLLQRESERKRLRDVVVVQERVKGLRWGMILICVVSFRMCKIRMG